MGQHIESSTGIFGSRLILLKQCVAYRKRVANKIKATSVAKDCVYDTWAIYVVKCVVKTGMYLKKLWLAYG